MDGGGQAGRRVSAVQAGKVLEVIIPNPKLKLLDQVREIMRLKHYSIRTEHCYCDWIRRYIKFHRMRSRQELLGGTGLYTHVLRQGGCGMRSPLDCL